MNWQEWAVAFLLLLCSAYIVRWGYSFFVRMRKKTNPCDGCATNCELKHLYGKKHASCREEHKETKKKCCG
ncbi:hypothetical protein [uncultured Bacteroides sp.]|uniref:hypothetical protein n=1 Tax=uncultured Bacteroides sp. TaxID=162156 RepID=UPI0026056C85|nr:hypothetical protein [uncultured Bacteroides sp.]